MPLSRLTFAWQATQNAEAYRLFMDGQQIADVAEVGLELERDVAYGSHTFAIEAYNRSGTGERIQVVRSLDEPPPPVPGPVEGFDVSILAIVTQPPPSGGGSPTEHGYTVTHYVAPFASVAGASSDDDVQNATAYSNATSASTPCTAACALANQAAGDVCEWAPGVYTKVAPSGRNEPAYKPLINTEGGAFAVHTAKYPAAYNRGNSALWSDLRYTGGDVNGESITIGCGGHAAQASHNVIFDGFYLNSTTAPNSPDGMCSAFSPIAERTSGIYFRRFYIILTWPNSDTNYSAFQIRGGHNCKVFDNYVVGDAPNLSHNATFVTLYGARGVEIAYNTVISPPCGVYVKGKDALIGNSGSIHHNRIIGMSNTAFEIAETEANASFPMAVYQNLVYDFSSTYSPAGINFDNEAASDNLQYCSVYNNTVVADSGNADPGVSGCEGGVIDGTGCEMRDNIFAYLATNSQVMVNAFQAGSTQTTNIDWNYNMYYNNGAATSYAYNGSASLTFAQFKTNTGWDANSVEGNPNFTDAANDDYTITSGTARMASSTGGPVGCYITNSEEIGIRANPTY